MSTSDLERLKNVLFVDKVYSGIAELRRRLNEPPTDVIDLRLAEYRIFSQNGEDGVLAELLRHLPRHSSHHFVEFGVGDGWSCNTRFLAEVLGWSGLYIEFDIDAHSALQERYRHCDRVQTLRDAVIPERVNEIFQDANVPYDFGVLSIDIDGQDYWVWDALSDDFQPDIVVVELNTSFGPARSVCEKLRAPQDVLTETFGASVSALQRLGARKGYKLVHVEMAGVNAFFLRNDHAAKLPISGILDRSPNFGLRGRFHSDEVLYRGGPRTPRPIQEV